MSLLDDKAKRMARQASLTTGPENLIDPTTIDLALNIIVDVIKLYKACNKTSTQAAKEMQAPGFFARRRLWRLCKGKSSSRASATDLYNSALLLGTETTPLEVHELYQDPRTAA
jgi:hypothetical protein